MNSRVIKKPMDKIKRSHISITTDYMKKLEKIKKSQKIKTNKEAIEYLIDNYTKGHHVEKDEINIHNFFGSKDKLESIKLVNDALVNSGLDFKELVRESLLSKASAINKSAKKLSNLSSDRKSLKASNIRGAADMRIEQMANRIIDHNNSQPEKINKICLSKGVIFKLTGCNRSAIDRYFNRYNISIEDHNKKHSLKSTDNRKGKNITIEKLLGLDNG